MRTKLLAVMVSLSSAWSTWTSPVQAQTAAVDANVNVQADTNDDWRYQWHNGKWWYYTPQNQWMVHHQNQWIGPNGQGAYYYNNQPIFGGGTRYSTGYRGNYYGNGYYNGGYNGNRYYNYGYPGYGNAYNGYNYGSRSANAGATIGGAIGGNRGANIGAAIGGSMGRR